jgi:hypothetical protein
MSLAMSVVEPKPVSTVDLASAVRLACSLTAQIAKLGVELEAAKTVIRDAAIAMGLSTSHGPVRIDTSVGECVVAHVADRLVSVQRVDLDALKSSIPAKLAAGLFCNRVAIRPDADDFVRALPPKDREKLAGKLEFRPSTPRVMLPSSRP